MIAALLLAFREGLEAALILGIVLSVLRRFGRQDQERTAWLGAGLAAVVSLGAGIGLYTLGTSFEGRAEQVFEGLTMLLAASVLTWMVFWMSRQGRAVQTAVEQNIGRAAKHDGKWAIFSLAFLAVVREGIELALFLTAATFTATAAATLVGGLLGLVLAALAGWLIFATTAHLDVRAFFRVTSFVLIFFAAGLVSHSVHEFNEAGIIPAVVEHVWNTNSVLDENSGVGRLLQALLGYNGNPSLTEVVAYVGYWVAVLLALRHRRRRAGQVTAPAQALSTTT
jgi:high-affinity iron transporter